jgi:hypothetical protein
MKYALLVLLSLPLLSFATETEVEVLEAELALEQSLRAQEKAEHLALMQRIVETVQDELQVEEEPEPEPNLIWEAIKHIYVWGMFISGIIAVMLGIVLTSFMLLRSLIFNYNLYVQHGLFAFVNDKDYDVDELRKDAKSLSKYTTKADIDELPWWNAIGFSLIGCIIFVAAAVAWPAVLVAFGPQLIINVVALRKRKKVVFQKKLKGEMKNESV